MMKNVKVPFIRSLLTRGIESLVAKKTAIQEREKTSTMNKRQQDLLQIVMIKEKNHHNEVE